MNFRKAKVSKATWHVPLVLALLAPTQPPSPMLPMSPGPAEMADAEAPSLAEWSPDESTATTCTNARRELRFEMLAVDAEVQPRTSLRPVVCLAVYKLPR